MDCLPFLLAYAFTSLRLHSRALRNGLNLAVAMGASLEPKRPGL